MLYALFTATLVKFGRQSVSREATRTFYLNEVFRVTVTFVHVIFISFSIKKTKITELSSFSFFSYFFLRHFAKDEAKKSQIKMVLMHWKSSNGCLPTGKAWPITARHFFSGEITFCQFYCFRLIPVLFADVSCKERAVLNALKALSIPYSTVQSHAVISVYTY